MMICCLAAVVLARLVSSLQDIDQWEALWPMTSEAEGRDVSGNGLHMTLGSGVRVGDGLHGNPQGGLYFPGVDITSRAKVTDPSFDLSNSSLAVSAFVRHTPGSGLLAGGYGPLLIFSGPPGSYGDKVWVDNGYVKFLIRTTDGLNHYIGAPVETFLPAGHWVYLTAYYDRPSGYTSLWRNGELVVSELIGASLSHQAYGDIRIGSWGSSHAVSGSIYCMGVTSQQQTAESILLSMFKAADRCHCMTKKDGTRGKQYIAYPGMKTEGATMKNVTVTDELQCGRFCVSVCGCVGFNLYSPGSDVGHTTGSSCLSECTQSANGDYQSCNGCDVYVTCSNGLTYDHRPCPAGLVWDDNTRRCQVSSSTCQYQVSMTTAAYRTCELLHWSSDPPVARHGVSLYRVSK